LEIILLALADKSLRYAIAQLQLGVIWWNRGSYVAT
jgi:hypothetical protein